jgi:hypothetical protein
MPKRFVGPHAAARALRRPAPVAASVVCALLWLASAAALAASPNQATSSRAAREDAVRSIPLARLDADVREKVSQTLAHSTLYRRLPVQVTPCDPDLYLFLVRHPEVVVNIWEVMGVSNVAIERTGPDTFRASDNMGTLCSVKFCYSDPETHVIYAEGSYSGPLFSRPVQARCVLLLKSGYLQETDGRHFVTSRMDTFIEIDHAGLELLARTLQVLVHRSADYNFVETAAFLSQVSRAAELNAGGVQRLAERLENVDEPTRDRFAEISWSVSEKARQRQETSETAAMPVKVPLRRSTRPATSRR